MLAAGVGVPDSLTRATPGGAGEPPLAVTPYADRRSARPTAPAHRTPAGVWSGRGTSVPHPHRGERKRSRVAQRCALRLRAGLCVFLRRAVVPGMPGSMMALVQGGLAGASLHCPDRVNVGARFKWLPSMRIDPGVLGTLVLGGCDARVVVSPLIKPQRILHRCPPHWSPLACVARVQCVLAPGACQDKPGSSSLTSAPMAQKLCPGRSNEVVSPVAWRPSLRRVNTGVDRRRSTAIQAARSGAGTRYDGAHGASCPVLPGMWPTGCAVSCGSRSWHCSPRPSERQPGSW